ncbi:DUF5610 domain-containing protein [Psychromonas ossibalaenae]|uniref:DUF5610 domain-containing protein n=1 Tax=Psychromonas ossibalaenae TaxID=444922 RepID=UPI00036FF7A9|nr:DUF5610 domain-containing protein [Psychromonas ossibalaenae]
MRIGMPSFQPAALFNKLLQSEGKNEISQQSNVHYIEKKSFAVNIMHGKLASSLGIPEQSAQQDKSAFDFEKAAENVLSFVTEAITKAKENGADDKTLKGMLHDAKKGIKTGFAEAKSELKDAGLMTKEIKNGIHEAKHLIKDGLKDFSKELFKPQEGAVNGMTNYREAERYNLTNDASFSITTNEGDQINITFNADYLQQSAAVLKFDENSMDYAQSNYESFNYAFSFEVNGELNEDEQAAVNELMGSLQNVSDLFFEGDLEDAFDEALNVGMDTSQLAAFSMNLQSTETYAAVKEYQQVLPGKEIADQLQPLNNELTDAYETAKPLALEEQLAGLLEWLNQEEPEVNKLIEYSQALFEQLAQLDKLSSTESLADIENAADTADEVV